MGEKMVKSYSQCDVSFRWSGLTPIAFLPGIETNPPEPIGCSPICLHARFPSTPPSYVEEAMQRAFKSRVQLPGEEFFKRGAW